MALDPNVPLDNYPFATSEGVAIPLDILRPNGVYQIAFGLGSFVLHTLPEEVESAVFYASEDCFVVFSSSATSVELAEFKENCLFCPKGHAITSSIIDPVFKLQPVSKSGSLIIQAIERWAGLSTNLTYTNR